MLFKKITTKSAQETSNLGQSLSKNLKIPSIICLSGNLGAGKTTFIQGLATGLGIKKRVISPTFVFIRQYQLDYGNNFYHLDLYRLDSINDAKSIGLEEILNDKKAIIAIEWPEKILEMLPKDRLEINFSYLNDKQRQIEIKSWLTKI